MKDAEDEAFDELAKRQGHWGGGYQAKKAMAADKLQEPDEALALEALKYAASKGYGRIVRENSAPFTIKEALAQPAQEPEREALKLALDDIAKIPTLTHGLLVKLADVEAVINEALAQPEQEPVCDKDPQGCWNVRCQLGKQCKNLAQPVQPQQDESDLLTIAYQSGFYDGKKAALAQPAQEPVALVIDGVLVKSALHEKYTGHLYTTPQHTATWVGLTEDELLHIGVATGLERAAAQMIADKLKEKNNGA